MRRVLSFVLLLLMGLPLVVPALALVGDSEAGLPACCRRNGAHRCSMRVQAGSDTQARAGSDTEARADYSAQTQEGAGEQGRAGSGRAITVSVVRERCPVYPAVVTAVRAGDLFHAASALRFAEVVSHPAMHVQTEARARVALDRSRQTRGPPARL